MNSLLFISTLLISSLSFAQSFDLKPGAWKIDMTVETGGKKMNPQAEMQKMMEKIPEAQRKQMMEMMTSAAKKSGNPGFLDLSRVCLTKEMIKDGTIVGKDAIQNCEHKVISRDSKQMKSSYKCEGGSKGEMEWNFVSSTSYTGRANVEDNAGRKTLIEYKGKHISDKCDK